MHFYTQCFMEKENYFLPNFHSTLWAYKKTWKEKKKKKKDRFLGELLSFFQTWYVAFLCKVVVIILLKSILI